MLKTTRYYNRQAYVPPCEELNEAVFLGYLCKNLKIFKLFYLYFIYKGGPFNSLYVLLDGVTVWLYNERQNAWKNTGPIYYLYRELEPDVRGGVKCNKGYTWFFKSKIFYFYYLSKSIKLYFQIIVFGLFKDTLCCLDIQNLF